MFAIIENGGKQYRVEPGALILVDQVQAEEGSTITLDKVLLVGGDGVKIGAPHVAGARVEARVVEHSLGDKVTTFKYRHRKRSRRTVGFRHSHTTLEILTIQG
jgi:large subunit ribosomal protein L21